MAARGFIGAGDVWINPYDPNTGAQKGWVGPKEAVKFALKPNSELKELPSKGRDTYGQILESVPLQRPAEFSMTLREADKDNLTLMFMGESASLSVAGATVAPTAYVLKETGGVQLAGQNISPTGFTLTSSPAGTTYVRDTDYTVNFRLGIVQAIPGSSLANAIAAAPAVAGVRQLTVLIGYTNGAISGTRVRGAVQPQLRAQIKFDGKNFADGLPVIAEVYEVILTPDGEFDFLADDWNELPLQGRMKTPVGKTEPFTVDFRTNAQA